MPPFTFWKDIEQIAKALSRSSPLKTQTKKFDVYDGMAVRLSAEDRFQKWLDHLGKRKPIERGIYVPRSSVGV